MISRIWSANAKRFRLVRGALILFKNNNPEKNY